MTRPEEEAPNALGLDASHLRRIGAILVLLDQRLDELERWVSWPLPSGPLYRWCPDLAPEARPVLREEVSKSRALGFVGLRRLNPQRTL